MKTEEEIKKQLERITKEIKKAFEKGNQFKYSLLMSERRLLEWVYGVKFPTYWDLK